MQLYNERFNSTRPREYDGRHLIFPGMNPEITLREHQRGAIAHDLYGGNTLLAHEVGAGKTFEMIAAAMEGKRLGLCQKSLFAVPNHLTEQWASEFLRLYPSANILVATKKDFETRNRKKFCARIATGDYDAVIIGHSQFERIPVSRERQERLLQEQIWEIEDGIAELKASRAERFTIKELERTKKNLKAKLQKLHDAARKDDVVTFEQLGVDRLYVDEAHSFKNLFLYTKMRNVAGLSTTDAQKSSDMLLKCRYIDEITHGKGVTFATGTPISNSMTELYTMMRYLQHDMLKRNSLTHFDCWASAFGETTTAIELAPEGTGYRARTRFAKFFNLPELMNLFREAADIKTADQLNLPTPTAVYHTEVTQPTALQQQKDNAGAAILEAFKDAKGLEPVPIGSYRGFAMSLTVENFGKDFVLTLKGKMSHRVELGKDARGNLVRIDNALAQMPERYKTVQSRLENVQAQLATAKAELGKPFPQEAELKEKSARLAELNAELNIDDRTPLEQAAENVVAKRPSVLGKLKAPCVHGAGEKKKSHEQEAR